METQSFFIYNIFPAASARESESVKSWALRAQAVQYLQLTKDRATEFQLQALA